MNSGEEEGTGRSETLVVCDVSVSFGGVRALRDVSLSARAGEVCGLIGPNGAGKTTLFKCITRRLKPSSGAISYGNVDILARAPYEIAGLGILQTFQEGGLFPSLTAIENVMLGAYHKGPHGAFGAVARFRNRARVERRIREEAREFLRRQDLEAVAEVLVGDLPYGTQKVVEVVRALMARPRFLLLDEPGAGLRADQREQLGHLLRELRSQDLGVVLVEHNMGMVMGYCDRVVALDGGVVIGNGSPEEIRSSRAVQEAYLGSARE